MIPLNFEYLYPGIISFGKSLVISGQAPTPNTDVDIPYLLPSPPTIREGVPKLAGSFRE